MAQRWDATSVLHKGAAATIPVFLASVVFGFFINLLLFVSPLYMLQIYDRVIASRSETTLIAITAIAALLILVYAILEMLRSRILVRAGILFDQNIASPVFEAIHKGGLKKPEIANAQSLRDVDTVREFLTGTGLVALFDAPWFPIFVVASFFLHPWFGYLSLAGSGIILALTFLNELITRKQLGDAGRVSISANQRSQAVFRNTEVLQALGMVPNMKRSWLVEHDKVLRLQASASDKAGTIIAATKFFRMFLQTAILGVGAYLVIQREISAGSMIAGSILIGRALQPIELAVANWKGFLAARSAYSRLKGLFHIAGGEQPRLNLPAPSGQVTTEHILAGAPGRQELILKGVSFALNVGDVLGVVGPSAAGKSTLARVLVGVWLPRSGTIRLDGTELSHWPDHQLGRYIGYLPQDVELFAGSVADNIARFGEVDEAELFRASVLAGCHDMIQRFPEGYNTLIGEGGQALSGGQRQRVGLARAFYGSPKFVVLDEPNASLDSIGEEALLRAIQQAKVLGTTIVIITQKLNVLAVVDKILVMADGQVSAMGSREEVMQRLTAPKVVPTTTGRNAAAIASDHGRVAAGQGGV